MKNVRFGLSLFSMVAFVLIASSFAQAQANRTWVASTGTDANTASNCSRTLPCRTFAGALSVTNQQGEIDVIDAGDFSNIPAGVLVINKSVTIDGGGLGFITGGNATNADAVFITTTDVHDVVTLRRLSINGAHFGGVPSAFFDGVRFQGSGSLVVERCQISNFSRSGINFQPGNGGFLFVRDSDLTNNEFFGIRAQSSISGLASCSIDNVRVSNNGIFGTGSGIVMLERTQANVSDSVSAYNGLVGIQAFPSGSTAEINIESTQITGNNINLQSGFSAGTGTIRISNVDIFDATANGLAFTAGSNILSFGNNRIAGNIGSNGPPSGTLPQQ